MPIFRADTGQHHAEHAQKASYPNKKPQISTVEDWTSNYGESEKKKMLEWTQSKRSETESMKDSQPCSMLEKNLKASGKIC
ncbi:hypothetical protein BCON_0303g00110 [Botryotinia convoluta]|uniref:Uncharacterized protein n=1 Tax=Botryotinia convoluta TaxID=54673 RepID=A0A4Z1HCJ7_9HELO|nr:hypothetical protein BCON_0303g00110 [Botryotinia convoluta]